MLSVHLALQTHLTLQSANHIDPNPELAQDLKGHYITHVSVIN